MTAPARPWENVAETLPASSIAPSSESLIPQSPTTRVEALPSSSSTSNALVRADNSAQNPATSSQQGVSSTNGITDTTNRYSPGYGSGVGYSGLGGMYGGGLGMGGMYGGGLGMGGMYGGGLGMGGLGMGMGMGMGGMYGMGMGGMSEDFMRSQMTFMLVGRLLEMCGMFAGVIQMTFGSALQFMGNYIGMSQQYNQLKSGRYMDESGKWVEVPKKITDNRYPSRTSRNQRIMKQKQKSGTWMPVLRRLLFFLLAIILAKKFMGWTAARQVSRVRN